MIKYIFRRKLLVAFLLCLCLASSAVFTGNVAPAYAKKVKQDNVETKQANYQDTSKQELVQLILSLKKTIESLDNRLANIESKLDVITSKDDDSKLSERWRNFSAKQKQVKEADIAVDQKNDQDVQVDEPVEVDTIVVETIKTDKVQPKVALKSDKDVASEKTTKQENLAAKENKVQIIAEKEDKVFLETETPKVAKKQPEKIEPKVDKVEETKVVEKVKTEKVAQKPEKKVVKIEPKKVNVASSSTKKIIKKFQYNITAETERVQGIDVGTVAIGGMNIITYRSTAAGIDPFARAQIVAKRIENYIANGGDIKKVQPALREGMYIGSVDGNVLFTVDQGTAEKSGLKIDDLTLSWVNNLRSALGAQKLKRTSEMMVSRSLSAEGRPLGRAYDRTKSNIIGMLLPMTTKDTGKVLYGGASWYGPYFHGRRAADGSRYNMYEMTAAHKSLPFGTIVKVTNLNNNRTCIVKITDRGPYIHGRIIDLSKAAAQKVGMIGSGTAKVKVEIIGKVPRFKRI